MNLDDIEEKFGGISRYQIFVITVSGIVVFGTSAMTQSAIFFSAVPEHRCAIPFIDNQPTKLLNVTGNNVSKLFIPPGDSCHRYNYNLSLCIEHEDSSCITNQTNVGKIKCDNGYVYNKTYFESTTVTEWDLVCGRTTLDALANSLYFAGVLIGSMLIGFMMDWFGRKLSILLSAIAFIVSGIAGAYAPSYEVYIALRVCVAMTGIPCFIAYFTYANEMSGKRSRKAFGCYVQMVGSVSHSILPGVAYLVQDWRMLGIMISLCSSPYIIIFFFMPRTPRWLLAHDKDAEAKSVVMRYAKSKNTKLNDEDWTNLIKEEKRSLKARAGAKNVLMIDYYRRPFMRVVSMVIIVTWFTGSMVFYGLVLNVGKLAGDPYVNRVLNGFVELFGYSLYLIPIKYIGLRLSTCFSYSLSGLCCLGTMMFAQAATGENASTMLEVSRWIGIFGKLFATSSFAIIYQYTAELFPTIARGTGMGMGSMAARVGSIIMPWTLELQKSIPWLTQTIFGCLALFAGTLSLLLPETSDTELTTTMEEAENFYRNNMKFVSRFIKKDKHTAIDEKEMEALRIPEPESLIQENAVA